MPLKIQLTHNLLQLIQHAADLRGQSVSEFVVAAAVAEAQRVLAGEENISVSAADQTRFASELLLPTSPIQGLKNAAFAHRNLVEPS